MSHSKVYGYCENLCKVEVPAKDSIYNENLLVNWDNLSYGHTPNEDANIQATNMTRASSGNNGYFPNAGKTSGSLIGMYRLGGGGSSGVPLFPMTLQVCYYNAETTAYTNKVYHITDSTTTSFAETFTTTGGGTITYTLTVGVVDLTVAWTSTSAIVGDTVSVVGAKMEMGNSPSQFDAHYGGNNSGLMLYCANQLAQKTILNTQNPSLETTSKYIVPAINEVNAKFDRFQMYLTHIEKDETVTLPDYASMCLIFIGRNSPSIYVGANNAVLPIVSNNNITATWAQNESKYNVSITNASYTCYVTCLYA